MGHVNDQALWPSITWQRGERSAMEVATRRQGEDARLGEYERLFEPEGERMWRTLCAFTGGRTDIAEEDIAEAFARAMASTARTL